MDQVAQELSRTLRTGTPQGRPVLIPDHGGPADRTVVGQMVGHGTLGALLFQDGDDLGDDFPRLLDQNGVPHPHILFRNEILIVEGGVGDGGAR